MPTHAMPGLPRAARIGAWIACLALLLTALLPAAVSASAPVPLDADPGQCVLCHQAEVQDWSHSPHAQAMTPLDHGDIAECQEATGADCTCLSCHSTNFDPTDEAYLQEGVTCEACHGTYVEGHPENGQMQLDVDSSVCSDCHVETHQEWQSTAHGEAGVQCIGCHRSHTQNLRLDDQALCKSCHRDNLQDAGHVSHTRAGLACLDCHTDPAATLQSEARGVSHDFAVNTAVCASCHGTTFHEGEQMVASGELAQQLAPMAERASADEEAAAQMIDEQTMRRRLQSATALSFGTGLGFGGILGIVFILVAGFLIQRPWRAKS
jgi:hypothetical protein